MLIVPRLNAVVKSYLITRLLGASSGLWLELSMAMDAFKVLLLCGYLHDLESPALRSHTNSVKGNP